MHVPRGTPGSAPAHGCKTPRQHAMPLLRIPRPPPRLCLTLGVFARQVLTRRMPLASTSALRTAPAAGTAPVLPPRPETLSLQKAAPRSCPAGRASAPSSCSQGWRACQVPAQGLSPETSLQREAASRPEREGLKDLLSAG